MAGRELRCGELARPATGRGVFHVELSLDGSTALRDAMLIVQTISSISGVDALAPEWERLESGLSPRVPFSSPEWCKLWWSHFHRSGLACRDQLRVYVVRRPDGALVGVAPMFLTSRPGWGVVRTRELQFFGADPYVTELRGPVCRPDDTAAVVEALSRHIAGQRECDWVQWRGLRYAGDAPHPELRLREDEKLDVVDHFLPVLGDWEAFRAGLPRNIRESLRKCYNSLKREGLAFEFRVVGAPGEVPAAIDRFFVLHRARAEQEGAVRHADVFDSARARALLRDYCLTLARRGALRIFQLLIDGAVVATRIGFVLGDEIYLYFSGYDSAYGRFSVMTTTVAEAIRHSIGRGVRIVNLSTGTDVSKTRWRPNQVVYRGGYEVCTAVKSRAAFRFVEALRERRPQYVARVA